jgi:hypothetical protein
VRGRGGDARRTGTAIRNRKGGAHLGSLHLQLHVVFSRRLAVLALLPAVAVATVAHLLPAVEQHGAALRPATRGTRFDNAVRLCGHAIA